MFNNWSALKITKFDKKNPLASLPADKVVFPPQENA
jgi:hypothetical protein